MLTSLAPQSSHVARADKTATPPVEEKGFGIMEHGQGGKPVEGIKDNKADGKQ